MTKKQFVICGLIDEANKTKDRDYQNALYDLITMANEVKE